MTQREMNLRPLSAVKHEIVYWFINLQSDMQIKHPKLPNIISFQRFKIRTLRGKIMLLSVE